MRVLWQGVRLSQARHSAQRKKPEKRFNRISVEPFFGWIFFVFFGLLLRKQQHSSWI